MNYMVVAPNQSEVVLGFGYHQHTLKHGTVIPDGPIIAAFPQYFMPIIEQEKPKAIPKVAKEESKIEKPKRVKTGGRVKGTFKTKGTKK